MLKDHARGSQHALVWIRKEEYWENLGERERDPDLGDIQKMTTHVTMTFRALFNHYVFILENECAGLIHRPRTMCVGLLSAS